MSNPSDPTPDEPTQAWGHPTEPGWGRPADSAGQPQPPYGAQPPHWAQHGGPPMPMPPPQHPSAMTAMGLGIFSLVGGFSCYLPILAAPFAWAVGSRAVREIDAEAGRWSGREMAKAGQVMGIVATVLLTLSVLALVGLVAVLLYTD